MKTKRPVETKIGTRVLLGYNFAITSRLHKPQSSDARKRYKFTLRPHDKKKYRFYAIQGSPGCVHIHFEEAK